MSDNPLKGPMMHGCARGYQMPRVVYAADRLTQPLIRTGERGSGMFREVGWDEALDYVAERLSAAKAAYGARSVIRLGGSGACRGALHHTSLLNRRFLSGLGGFTDITGSYSSQAATYAAAHVYGSSPKGIDPATLQFSRLLILWGANIVDTRFGCETESWIRRVKGEGVPVIVIDPRRSRTVEQLATEWIPVFPGTDSALMAGVLHVLITEGMVDREFVAKYSVGFDKLERYILGSDGGQALDPRWASTVCGTSEDMIVRLARVYGSSKPAALLPGLSIQRTVGGEEATRMAIALQVATGNVGIPGGSGAVASGLPGPRLGTIAVPAAADCVGVPVYRWADAVLDGREGGYPSDIRVIYNMGGNYISQGSDVRKSIQAFQAVEFSVCHDSFLTPTARYCDVVLPTTTFLEREDVMGGRENYLFYSGQAIAPVHQSRNDYDILWDLATRLGFGDAFSEGLTATQWIERLIEESEVDDPKEFRRTGIYDGGEHLRVGLSTFIADPQTHPLTTPSGKIEIASDTYAQTGFADIPTCRILPDDSCYPLRMVTPHARYRINSTNANLAWFREQEEQVLWIHPRDAVERGVEDGQQILVYNDRGRTKIRARVTDAIMGGVVCLLQGQWPSFDADGTDVAGSANVLTTTEPTQPSQGSRTHSTLVQVARLG
ncbi:MAG: molybdopterin-dependent oxidoreductase [Anaerolineae bacterium]|nr:molybdopterin-dependent oxidoreductase [Anaerolineae bacterium]